MCSLNGETTQESIDRLQRVKLKRDVNGLEGRVKPSVYGTCWFASTFEFV